MTDAAHDAGPDGRPAAAAPLLSPDDPPPVTIEGADRGGAVVITCEHGGRAVPARLGDLGLPADALARHFMWDIGALALARALAAELDAPLVWQPISRMVCDCNRPPFAESLVPEIGEELAVPGNRGLSAEARRQRVAEVWQPFQDALAALLAERRAAGVATALLAVHTFTPRFFGTERPWHAGVLFDRDRTFAPALLEALSGDDPRIVANEPYRIERDVSDWTIPVHGEDNGLPSALLEVRNDLLATAAGVSTWAERIAAATRDALCAVGIAHRAGRAA